MLSVHAIEVSFLKLINVLKDALIARPVFSDFWGIKIPRLHFPQTICAYDMLLLPFTV